jgi:predicted peroxiredoxin
VKYLLKGYPMNRVLILLLSITFVSNIFAKPIDIVIKPKKKVEKQKEQNRQDIKQNGKNMVFLISSGELMKASMGFTLGLSGAKKGYGVTLVLGADSLKYALKEGKQNRFLAKDLTPREILAKALKNGAKIYICYMCAKALNLNESDFIDGVKIVKSNSIFDEIFRENSKVLSF